MPSSRYRHPGDVIRLISAGLVLVVSLAAVALAPGQLIGSDASAVTWLGYDPAGRLLAGLVQVAFVVAATGIVAIALRHRRFRLLASLAAGAMVAGGALAGILHLIGGGHPPAVAASTGQTRVARVRRLASLGPRVAPRSPLAVGTMAEHAGVRVPRVERVIKAADGTALLAMERVAGSSLDRLPAERISDEVLQRLWAEVHRLHRAGIAHRALRAANVMVDDGGQPWLTDFSFSDLTATQRHKDLDLAELMASLAVLVGADRAVSGATAVIGTREVAAAAPLLQPLALSAATRHSIAGHQGLLAKTRSAAATAGGSADQQLARIQRVRPRTLLTIAALAGAFYFLLPQLAQVGSSWNAIQSAHWAWLPVVIAMSALTYLASAISLIGGVPGRVPFWPTVLAQRLLPSSTGSPRPTSAAWH